MFHESLAATEDMAVLPGVLGCRTLRRTVQVRLGSNTLHAAQAPALRAVARWQAHLHGLATVIHETSGLAPLQRGNSHHFNGDELSTVDKSYMAGRDRTILQRQNVRARR